MKAPICSVCLASDMLCQACKEKLESGKITEMEAKVSREIYQLSKKARTLEGVDIIDVVEAPDAVIILTSKGHAPRLVGKAGVIVKQLTEKLGKRVRVVEKSQDMREFIQNLIYPVPVLGLNVVYGKKRDITLVKVPKKSRLPVSSRSLKNLVLKLSETEIEIEGTI